METHDDMEFGAEATPSCSAHPRMEDHTVSSPFVVRWAHMAIVRRLVRVLHPWAVRMAVKGEPTG